jgi:hypothetical protein
MSNGDEYLSFFRFCGSQSLSGNMQRSQGINNNLNLTIQMCKCDQNRLKKKRGGGGGGSQ